jgi:hypothetical protein
MQKRGPSFQTAVGDPDDQDVSAIQGESDGMLRF